MKLRARVINGSAEVHKWPPVIHGSESAEITAEVKGNLQK